MRADNPQFKGANEAPGKSPRFVVAIIYDTASIYITSHSDIPNVPGTVLQGALQKPSAISQKVVPDEGRSEIGVFSFDVVDLSSTFTAAVRAKLGAGAGMRGRVVRLYVGFKGFDFSAFQLFQTQVVSDCTYKDGVYSVTCEDITRQQRVDICEPKVTTLAASLTATDATITVADTAAFLSVFHGVAWSDAPSQTVYYLKLEKEIIRATGKTSTQFTGCTRGVFNTLAVAHTIDTSTTQERRVQVEEFIYLDLPAPKLALALITGGIFQTWPANLLGSQGAVQTDSNADGTADGWSFFVGSSGDGARVQTASLVAGSSPFSGNAQRGIITSVGNSNDSGFAWQASFASGLTMTVSGYIRTNATGVHFLMRFQDAAGNGLLDCTAADVASDSVAHLNQVTGTAPAGTHSISIMVRGINAAAEFLEFDNVICELGSVAHPYTSAPIQGVLPEHWHVGIAAEFVAFSDFTGIGVDLWDTTDDSKGFQTRFEGLDRQDGKTFLEKQLYLLLGSYSPIYSDGTIGLRRLPAMVSDATPVGTLTEREIIDHGELQHDFESLHNRIRVTWGYDLGLGKYTRDTLFLDAQSITIHGEAKIIEYTFRGLHSGSHTENMIRLRLDTVRDAYTYPPERLTATCVGSCNRYEVADVLRIQCANLRDFAGSGTNIDRSFVALRRSIDFESGDVAFELFGSTLRPDALPPSTEATAPLPDAFYNSAGVALSTLVSMTGNNVNAGTYTITGNANLTASGAIVYHLGDLNIPSGVTINIAQNVQLRVRGFVTLNGTISGNAGGLTGVADPGPPPNGFPVDGLGAPTMITGNPGFIGNARGWDGLDIFSLGLRPPLQFFRSHAVALTKSRFEAWPTLNLEVSGTSLVGLPTDLRGTGGAPGGRTVATYSSNQTSAGGTGGAGGAGLCIVARGMSFGVSSLIRLNGADTTNPAAVGIPLVDVYPGAGAAGGPGALLILMDGNTQLFPNALGHVQLKTGIINQGGLPLESREDGWAGGLGLASANPDRLPWSGYHDEATISNLDMSVAALKIQYIPTTQTPAADDRGLPPPVTSISVTPGAETNTIRLGLPALDTFDAVEIWAAITNDRTGALRVARGRIDEFTHNLAAIVTRYYWARTVKSSPLGVELVSDWNPAGSTSGVVGTTLNPSGWTPITTAAGGATMIVTASSIEKSGGSSTWDSQAYSAESYPACAVSWRAADATHNFMIGLNTDPATDAVYTSIDYAWYCDSAGHLDIYESGTGISTGLTYDATTVVLITYDGERVRYFRNGVIAREVLAPGRVLSLDSSFYSPGAKAVDVKFGPSGTVSPANGFGLTGNAKYAGVTLEKLGGSLAYDSSAYSLDGYGACYLTFTPLIGEFCIGLNTDPQLDSNYTSIDFSWIPFAGGAACWIYEGAAVLNTGAWTSSTVLSITYDGQWVRYLKDNVIVREVLFPKRVLFFDSALASVGSKATNVKFGSSGVVGGNTSAFVARNACVVINDTIEKIGGSGAWDSDVYSKEGYSEGAFCSAQIDSLLTHAMFALNTDPTTDQSYTSLDYAWFFEQSTNHAFIYESNTSIGDFGAYTTSTVLAIRHIGALVQYIKDGVVVRSVTRVATTPLYFDCSVYVGRLINVHFGPAGRGAEADPSAVYLETFESPWPTSFRDFSNSGSLVATYPNNGQFGGKVISAQNQLYIISNENIPFDANALYRITTRMRRTVAGGAGVQNVYCGLWGYAADGTTLINNQWNCVSAFDMGTITVNTWRDFVGYVKGLGSTFGVAANVDSPTNMDAGTCFVRPSIVMNYNSGAGTMECDFIKLERLVGPDDADNSDKSRIVPDSEFSRATDQTYWWFYTNGAGGSPTISLTGGLVGGYCNLPTHTPGSNYNYIVSRRKTFYQAARGQIYTITIRVRDLAAPTTVNVFASLIRHARLGSNATFSPAPGSGVTLDTVCAGGLYATGLTTDWKEYSGIVFVQGQAASGLTDGDVPAISAIVGPSNSGAGTSFDVDLVKIEPGATVPPQNEVYTASTNFGTDYFRLFKNLQFNHATVAGTFTLPTAAADYIGARVYLEQIGAALLTVAVQGGDTLQSAPNVTGSRNMLGKYARAYAEIVAANTWRIYGQLA